MILHFRNVLAATAAGAVLFTTTAAAAETTRPGSAVPAISKAVTQQMGKRQSKRVKADERLVGLPLALVILLGVGASAVAITQVTKNNAKNPRKDSRG